MGPQRLWFFFSGLSLYLCERRVKECTVPAVYKKYLSPALRIVQIPASHPSAPITPLCHP